MAPTFLLCGRETLISINIQIKHNLSVSVPLNRCYINKGPGNQSSFRSVTVPGAQVLSRELIALNTLIVER